MMLYRNNWLALITVLLFSGLGASASNDQKVLLQEGDVVSDVVSEEVDAFDKASQRVLLKEGDVVSVTVFNEGSLSGAFPVGPDGMVVLPLLGGIPAIGRTPKDLAVEIEGKLEAEYIRDAQVVAAMAKKAKLPPHTVTVIGQVAKPGRVPFEADSSIDLFTAIASVGGLAEGSNQNRIELKRRKDDDLQTSYLAIDEDRNFKLRKGDTIIVHALKVERAQITVIGQVKRPGAIKMNPKEPFDIITAIAVAGGFTPIARPTKVVVRRRHSETDVETVELNITKMQRDQSAPFVLQANDTIFVPESIF